MTREEQIKTEAITESVNLFLNPDIYNDKLAQAHLNGFKHGA